MKYHSPVELHVSAAYYNTILEGRNPLLRIGLWHLVRQLYKQWAVFVGLEKHSVHRAGNYFLIFTVLKINVCTETCCEVSIFKLKKYLST